MIAMSAGPPARIAGGACDHCLRRTALIAGLAGRLDIEWRRRAATARVLALPDDDLLDLAPPPAMRAYARFDAAAARARAQAANVHTLCRCQDAYPEPVRALPDPPAVLHILGRPDAIHPRDAVAIVGARRATTYGLDVSRSIGHGL